MNRRGFMTRLGMFAALPVVAVAASTMDTVQPPTKTVINGDVEINGTVTINSQDAAKPSVVMWPKEGSYPSFITTG